MFGFMVTGQVLIWKQEICQKNGKEISVWYCLDDNGNIVDQYQPCAIVAENGAMMKGTGRRCYVTAPAGTYELSVLFRKRGETTWQKANRKDNATKKI